MSRGERSTRTAPGRITPDAAKRLRSEWLNPEVTISDMRRRFGLSDDAIKRYCADLGPRPPQVATRWTSRWGK